MSSGMDHWFTSLGYMRRQENRVLRGIGSPLHMTDAGVMNSHGAHDSSSAHDSNISANSPTRLLAHPLSPAQPAIVVRNVIPNPRIDQAPKMAPQQPAVPAATIANAHVALAQQNPLAMPSGARSKVQRMLPAPVAAVAPAPAVPVQSQPQPPQSHQLPQASDPNFQDPSHAPVSGNEGGSGAAGSDVGASPVSPDSSAGPSPASSALPWGKIAVGALAILGLVKLIR